jgi:ankyrin repeat protein
MSDLHVKVATAKDDDQFSLQPELPLIEINSAFHPLGWTPLHIAVAEMKSRVVKKLIERGADVNAVDCAGRDPFDYLLSQLKQPRRPTQQLRVLRLLSQRTELKQRQIGGKVETHELRHQSRADHLVQACNEAHGLWNGHLAQLLLQQSAENSWLDACKKLIGNGAELDKPSPWDARLPRQIGMASSLPQLRNLFQKHGTVSDACIRTLTTPHRYLLP